MFSFVFRFATWASSGSGSHDWTARHRRNHRSSFYDCPNSVTTVETACSRRREGRDVPVKERWNEFYGGFNATRVNGRELSPLPIIGAALGAGFMLAKLIDWRGHAHPRI
jgi:hypothetical protein